MSLNEIFRDRPEEPQSFKSLRLYAREAAEYLTGRPYLPPTVPNLPLQKPGRGASGESSN